PTPRKLIVRISYVRVAAHHGSLSRRARLEAENRLKEGELRALVATSSLELGIDVGAIDLVVQLQSPRNIAAALQRVGRAGHLLTRVSKGRIVVTRGEELLEAAAVVRSIRARELDQIAVPEAPLDVLAQQIVAAVAAESVSVDTLWHRFRNAAPYRTLSREDFVAVVRSLAEPLPAEVKGAAPRILWDRVNDRLHRGAAAASSPSPRAGRSPTRGSSTSSSPRPISRWERSTRSSSPRASRATSSSSARTPGRSSRSAPIACSSRTPRACRRRSRSGRVSTRPARGSSASPSAASAGTRPTGSTLQTSPTGRARSVVLTRAPPRRC